MPRTAPLPGISARPAALDGGFRADRVSRRLSRPFRPSFHLQFYLIDRRGMPRAAQLLLAMGPVWWTATAGLPFGVPGLQLGGLSTKTGVARRRTANWHRSAREGTWMRHIPALPGPLERTPFHFLPGRILAANSGWWGRKDSNLRSHTAADLQSAPFATRDTSPSNSVRHTRPLVAADRSWMTLNGCSDPVGSRGRRVYGRRRTAKSTKASR